ncbi:MAG: F0F1 ATP synthase subunit B [Chloroflexi bacterium]|nr:F0F1 ATP synthase subunit B [Chloroflexota bacterium]
MQALGISPNLLITQIVNFIILLVVLRLLLYKPVLNMLHSRRQKIQESLEYAERVKAEAAEQQKEFERKLEETRRETQAAAAAAAQVGEKEREAILNQAREDARKLVEQAKEQIEYERKKMMADLRDEVVRLSLLAAQKVIGQSLDDQAHRQLVSEFIAQADQLPANGHNGH